MRGTVDDPHEPVIANQENAAEVIVTDRPGSGTETARPAALMTRVPGGTDSDMPGIAQAALTDTGTARYDGLYQQQHRPLQVTEPVMFRRHHAQVPVVSVTPAARSAETASAVLQPSGLTRHGAVRA